MTDRFKVAPHARERRVPYRGKVRLLVPFAPWRLLLTLEGLNISGSGLLALLPAAMKDGAAAHGLLMAGDPYDLQLEFDSDEGGTSGYGAAVPSLRARLVRSVRTTVGWELAFTFDEADGGLLGLLHELDAAERAKAAAR